MKRSKIEKSAKYDINQEPIVLSKQTLDILLKSKQKEKGDPIVLYTFYYYTAKWQKTNQPKATIDYVRTGLGWSAARVRKAKKILVQLNLIKDINSYHPKTNKITGWYVHVNFIWSKNTDIKNHPTRNHEGGGKTTLTKSHRVENHKGNALSTNNLNALSTNNRSSDQYEIFPKKQIKQLLPKIKYITPSQFEKFYKSYPKKVNKGSALTAWNKLCKLPSKEPKPTFRQLLKAIKEQKKTKQWENKKYIPLPATWLNNNKWLNEIDGMNYEYEDKDDFKKEYKNLNDPDWDDISERSHDTKYNPDESEEFTPGTDTHDPDYEFDEDDFNYDGSM